MMTSLLIRKVGEERRLQLLATAVIALALAGTIGAVAAAPAHADDYRGFERHDDHWDRGGHWRDRDWRWHHRGPWPDYVAPAPVYAPPPVVYAPPPQPPGLNLIFPINIR